MLDKEIDIKPANCLEDIVLNDGWKVIELIKKSPKSTGGHFSVGYRVKKDDIEAYMKALDFSLAFQSPDTPRILQAMTSAYNFERDLLAKCKTRHMRYVVKPIADGAIDVPGFSDYNKVFYIIFELADGDVRKIMSKMREFDLAWCLRSLHNVAVGLDELHFSGIAHQDIKPSNILIFKMNTSKISDLGRASDRAKQFDTDRIQIPGDKNYAPPEQFYGYRFTGEFDFRYAADMYHLGSLLFFYFSGLSATQTLQIKFIKTVGSGYVSDSFESDLPYLQQAFEEALHDLEQNISKITQKYTLDLLEIVRQLCNPDPKKRGHPKNILYKCNQYALERYISKLDLLARKIELKLL